MKFPGHMTADEALKRGFTHHGKYYGIPVWLAPDDPDFPVVTKWAPLEGVMTAIGFFECIFRLIFGDEELFQFLVTGKIETKKAERNDG